MNPQRQFQRDKVYHSVSSGIYDIYPDTLLLSRWLTTVNKVLPTYYVHLAVRSQYHSAAHSSAAQLTFVAIRFLSQGDGFEDIPHVGIYHGDVVCAVGFITQSI